MNQKLKIFQKKFKQILENLKIQKRIFISKIRKIKFLKKINEYYSKFSNWKTKKPQKFIFEGISLILFLTSLYLVIYPFAPKVIYEIFYKNKSNFPYKTRLKEQATELPSAKFGEKDVPNENRLVIPSISVDMPVVEGNSEKALNLGLWHRPGTGIPGKGNIVITGHRVGYAFLPNDVKTSTSFYNLDKLKNGDYIILYWQGKEYNYQVIGSEIVKPTAIEIESQSGEERMTLYTCHPIGSNANRLVYYAKPIKINEN